MNWVELFLSVFSELGVLFSEMGVLYSELGVLHSEDEDLYRELFRYGIDHVLSIRFGSYSF